MKLRILFLTASIIVILGFVYGWYLSSLGATKTSCEAFSSVVTIEVNEAGFNPATTTISKCTKVVFKNSGTMDHWPASDLHPTHGIYPEFDPQKPVKIGESWSFVFDRIGKWKCHDHLSAKLRCTIEVIP